jgi:hypothetical protein
MSGLPCIADLPDEDVNSFCSIYSTHALLMRYASNGSRLRSHLLNFRLCDLVRLYAAHFNKLRVQE